MKKIKYGSQNIDSKDIAYVKKALNHEIITTGNFVVEFEEKLKKYFNSKYLLSCSSGTSALHLAIESVGIEKNDNIIVPIINFSALTNVLYSQTNANIYFADVDPLTGQVTPDTVINCIIKNKIKKVKAIFVMHLSGSPNNVYQFYKLKKKLNCYLIEDACHALGASYKISDKKYKIGSCKHSDISLFSFHPVKSITTGEGGAFSTNSKNLYLKAKQYRSHGIIRKNKKYWIYDVKKFGLNYRLSDINSALGISQIKKLNKFIKKRRLLASQYDEHLKNINKIKIVNIDNIKFSSWHLLIVLIDFEKLKLNKEKFIKYLNINSIFAQIHYIPFYEFTVYKFLRKKNYPNAERFYKNCLSFPIHTKLAGKDIKFICNCIKNFLKKNR